MKKSLLCLVTSLLLLICTTRADCQELIQVVNPGNPTQGIRFRAQPDPSDADNVIVSLKHGDIFTSLGEEIGMDGQPWVCGTIKTFLGSKNGWMMSRYTKRLTPKEAAHAVPTLQTQISEKYYYPIPYAEPLILGDAEFWDFFTQQNEEILNLITDLAAIGDKKKLYTYEQGLQLGRAIRNLANLEGQWLDNVVNTPSTKIDIDASMKEINNILSRYVPLLHSLSEKLDEVFVSEAVYGLDETIYYFSAGCESYLIGKKLGRNVRPIVK